MALDAEELTISDYINGIMNENDDEDEEETAWNTQNQLHCEYPL